MAASWRDTFPHVCMPRCLAKIQRSMRLDTTHSQQRATLALWSFPKECLAQEKCCRGEPSWQRQRQTGRRCPATMNIRRPASHHQALGGVQACAFHPLTVVLFHYLPATRFASCSYSSPIAFSALFLNVPIAQWPKPHWFTLGSSQGARARLLLG